MTLRPSVCIDAVLEKLPLSAALELVAEVGFEAFEFWKWWEKDLDALLAARDKWNLQVAACCTRFISLVDPNVRHQYLDGLAESVKVAQRLACPVLISQVGDGRSGIPRPAQHQSLIDGLRAAVPILEHSGVTLAIEPLNERIDHPGYYLVHSREAFEIVEQVNSPHIKVTFDIYHQQISEGDIIATIQSHVDKIAHFHAAGNPGRHELNRGELHYPGIFAAIEETSYDGYVGLEYWPLDPPEQGLRQVAQWFAGARGVR